MKIRYVKKRLKTIGFSCFFENERKICFSDIMGRDLLLKKISLAPLLYIISTLRLRKALRVIWATGKIEKFS